MQTIQGKATQEDIQIVIQPFYYKWGEKEIRGRLEKARLPRIDQPSLKPNRDLHEQFIVRDAAWSPRPSLLSPERPFHEAE